MPVFNIRSMVFEAEPSSREELFIKLEKYVVPPGWGSYLAVGFRRENSGQIDMRAPEHQKETKARWHAQYKCLELIRPPLPVTDVLRARVSIPIVCLPKIIRGCWSYLIEHIPHLVTVKRQDSEETPGKSSMVITGVGIYSYSMVVACTSPGTFCFYTVFPAAWWHLRPPPTRPRDINYYVFSLLPR